MDSLTLTYITRAEIWLIVATLAYFLMNGAQIFETAVFVPKWAESPPNTFGLLNMNGVSLKTFWIVFHSVHEVIFILTLIFCWKIEPVRNWLLILLAAHIAVRLWTLMYFAPNIILFQELAQNDEVSAEITRRVSDWKMWNYLRVALFIIISIGFVPLCFKLIQLKNNLVGS